MKFDDEPAPGEGLPILPGHTSPGRFERILRAGKGGSDAYLEEWRRVTTSIEADGALEEIAAQLGREIEAQFSDEQLALMVKQKGFAEVAS